jgi:hypothetical protein
MDQPPVAPTMSHEAPSYANGHPRKWLTLVTVSLAMMATLLDATNTDTRSYRGGALVAFLATILALSTERRIGEHAGHGAMSHAECVAETV